jgi:hypothetical protein
MRPAAAPVPVSAPWRLLLPPGCSLLSALLFAACCNPPCAAAELPPSKATEAAAPVPITLRFAELYQWPVGPQGLVPTDKLSAAAGHEVQLRGWMVAQEALPRGYFLLTARPVRLSEHADGEADDLPAATVLVRLPPAPPSQTESPVAPLAHQPGLIELTGTLRVGRSVEPDGRVSWVQLQLH